MMSSDIFFLLVVWRLEVTSTEMLVYIWKLSNALLTFFSLFILASNLTSAIEGEKLKGLVAMYISKGLIVAQTRPITIASIISVYIWATGF